MLDRRRFASLFGTTALASLAAPARISRAFAQGAAPAVLRGNYLIKNAAVITVDRALGVLPRADIHVNNGRIEAIRPDLAVTGAEIIDASDMIVSRFCRYAPSHVELDRAQLHRRRRIWLFPRQSR